MINKIRQTCGNGLNCPALHRKQNGRMIVSGPTVTDPELLDELALPDNESAVEVPAELITGEDAPLLDVDGLADFVGQHHTRDLFRLETLPFYAVDSDGDDYHRYLRGEPTPNAAAKQPWLDHLRADIAAGRRWRRVHALTTPLSDYLRYECEWAYTDNTKAGEDVRIIDNADAGLLAVSDFFVLDGEHVVRSHYDQAGQFVGAEVVGAAPVKALYLSLSDLIWRLAEPFTAWWERHPEYHRAGRVA